LKINQFRDVVAVAEHGSMHAAARYLGVAQPALTRSIRALERDLGVPLFERRSRGVAVTPIGEIFVLRAKAILADMSRARDEIVQLRGMMRGRVTISMGVMPHLTLLPYALKAFRQKFPDVQLEIKEGRFPENEAALRAGLFDFFVGPRPRHALGQELAVETLYEQEAAIMCRKGHPLSRARSLRRLADASWLMTSITQRIEDELAVYFERYGLPPPTRLVVRSHTALTVLVAVASSDLLVCLPAGFASNELCRTALVRIPLSEELPTDPIVLIRRGSLPLTPAAEFFCDAMRRASVHLVQDQRTLAG
jgi:DNA-binding transcriptional LysR family regulator